MRLLVRLLAGLQAGMIGGTVTLVWLMLGAWVLGEPPWLMPNLLAGAFYGDRSLTSAPGWMTLSGAALHLVECAVSAMVLAVAIPLDWGWRRGFAAALLFTLLWQGAAVVFLWRRYNPNMHYYAPPGLIWSTCVLFGLCLGPTAWLIRSLKRNFLVE